MTFFRQSLAMILLTASSLLGANPPSIDIWQGVQMPGSVSAAADVFVGKYEDDSLGYKAVNRAALDVYKADAKNPAGAVIICPGGGYGHLAYGKEGTQIAKFLSANGIHCFVLKYRVPQNRDGAFQDARRAIRIVRKNAESLGVDPDKIGIMGFSAGGHLSARVSTNFDESSYEAQDEVDKLSTRPDFTVLIYPAYIADNVTYALSPEIKVGVDTPPAFISQTQDDTAYIGSSIGYYLALKQNNVPADMHLYAVGQHGYGLRIKDKPVSKWGDALVDWLKFNKYSE